MIIYYKSYFRVWVGVNWHDLGLNLEKIFLKQLLIFMYQTKEVVTAGKREY
jgi:hypothetical protein